MMINIEESTSETTREIEDQNNIGEVIGKYIYHWPVFLLGIVFCVISAYFYLRYTDEIYSVNTTLLIKDERKGGAGGGDLLTNLDLFGSSKVVDNEIEILKSKTLMRKVVDRLNLTIGYR